MEGGGGLNPLLLPFQILSGKVFRGGESPSLLGRVIHLRGETFYHLKDRGRVSLPRGLRFRQSDYCRGSRWHQFKEVLIKPDSILRCRLL